MATKTLTITEDAYNRLASLKEGKESFSDVIKKITDDYAVFDLVGLLTEKEAKALDEEVRKNRKRFTMRDVE